MSGRADKWIRWTTTGCAALLALIAGTVSYLHMHTLVEWHGQTGLAGPWAGDGAVTHPRVTLPGWARLVTRSGAAGVRRGQGTCPAMVRQPVRSEAGR